MVRLWSKKADFLTNEATLTAVLNLHKISYEVRASEALVTLTNFKWGDPIFKDCVKQMSKPEVCLKLV